MAAKVHWNDEHGPICGARQYESAINGPKDLREVRQQDLRAVTCKRCAKKLHEWGFAVQSFSEIVQDAIARH